MIIIAAIIKALDALKKAKWLKGNGALWALLAAVLIFKIALFWWGVAQFDFAKNPHEDWQSVWYRWDAGAYGTIAAEGYRPQSVEPDAANFFSHFPPLYPILIRIISLTGLSVPTAAMLISWMAALASCYVLYQIVLSRSKIRRAAILAVIFFTIYPLSYFTLTGYAESLFILLTLLSFWMLQKKNMTLAGIAGVAAILTRITGIGLLPAYVYVIIRDWRRRQLDPRHFLLIALPLLALLGYLILNAVYFQDPFFFIKEYQANAFSGKKLTLPFAETLQNLKDLAWNFRQNIGDERFMIAAGWNAIFTVWVLTLTIIGITKKIPWEFTLYSLSSILLFASFSWGVSNARYTLPLFPIFITMALFKNNKFLVATGILSAVLLFYFAKLFTAGGWTF